jgi:GH15 family glucan-1,4-alpha-glucosidase
MRAFGETAFMSSRIEDYALIGDCETAALVSKDGSIDWLCWPRFDSAACFAALLGNADNGRWQIAPAVVGGEAKVRIKRQYRRNTLVLETEFTAADGSAAVLIDFMPVRQGRAESRFIRLVVGKRGTVAMHSELIVRFGYGGWTPWVTRRENGDLLAIAGPDMLHLGRAAGRADDHGQRLRSVGRTAGTIRPHLHSIALADSRAGGCRRGTAINGGILAVVVEHPPRRRTVW